MVLLALGQNGEVVIALRDPAFLPMGQGTGQSDAVVEFRAVNLALQGFDRPEVRDGVIHVLLFSLCRSQLQNGPEGGLRDRKVSLSCGSDGFVREKCMAQDRRPPSRVPKRQPDIANGVHTMVFVQFQIEVAQGHQTAHQH